MPIISSIGRKQLKSRLLIGSIYAILSLGALTMLYPFGLMIAGTSKSGVDFKEQRLVPAFLRSDEALYQKHVEGLFNESLDKMKTAYDLDPGAFDKVELPETDCPKLTDEWEQFLGRAELPHYTYGVGYVQAPVSRQTVPHVTRDFRGRMRKRFDGDLDALNRELGTEFVGWSSFFVLPPEFLLRREKPSTLPFAEEFKTFKSGQPNGLRYYFSTAGFYKALFLKTQYTRDIETYNASHGTDYASYDEVFLTRRLPAGGTPKEQSDWVDFVRNSLNLFWVRADAAAAPLYREYLAAKYGSPARLNERYGTSYGSFADVALITDPPAGGLVLSDWESFIIGWEDPDPETGRMHMCPAEMLYIDSVDFRFRDYLSEKYGGLDGINAALGTAYRRPEAIRMPQQDLHYRWFVENKAFLRREFACRNFIAVFDYMVLHGRGMVNTALYCFLAVLAALIVNPVAAYALSRFNMPSAYKVLLFLMVTMAFPPMVTQIPVFLMLREFRLLNTFAALILPGLANGYSIFLLKGFFDSQPKELFEAAALDGAGEWVMFWQLTMNLSKPILAVIGLQAFTLAYSNFMYALLICQDRKMWTLMVWLYELQRRSAQGVIFASLIVAAVPTFLMFAFCQNIIMRGIVVPAEK